MEWNKIRFEYRNFLNSKAKADNAEFASSASKSGHKKVDESQKGAMLSCSIGAVTVGDNCRNPALRLSGALSPGSDKPACAILHISYLASKISLRLDVHEYELLMTCLDSTSIMREKPIPLLDFKGEGGSFTLVSNTNPKSKRHVNEETVFNLGQLQLLTDPLLVERLHIWFTKLTDAMREIIGGDHISSIEMAESELKKKAWDIVHDVLDGTSDNPTEVKGTESSNNGRKAKRLEITGESVEVVVLVSQRDTLHKHEEDSFKLRVGQRGDPPFRIMLGRWFNESGKSASVLRELTLQGAVALRYGEGDCVVFPHQEQGLQVKTMKTVGYQHNRVGYTVETDESFKNANVRIELTNFNKLIRSVQAAQEAYTRSFLAITGTAQHGRLHKPSLLKPPTEKELERATEGAYARMFKNMSQGSHDLNVQFGNFGSLKALQESLLGKMVDISYFDERFFLEKVHIVIMDPLEDLMDGLSKAHYAITADANAEFSAEADWSTSNALQHPQRPPGMPSSHHNRRGSTDVGNRIPQPGSLAVGRRPSKDQGTGDQDAGARRGRRDTLERPTGSE